MDEAIASYAGAGAPPDALAFRDLARAELARVMGEHDPVRWRAAGDAFRALDMCYQAAYTDFRTSEALAQTGANLEEIAQPLKSAHAVTIEIGARPLQKQVEALAREAGVLLEDAGLPAPTRPQRMLATVLFTDIVGSTARAAELGDQRWRMLLDRHDAIVRREVGRGGGNVVQFVGDGSLSTFDGPARAIDCAIALTTAVKTLGIELRGGVHTGEIELRGRDIGGIAVHIGARVAARAGASEILVSQTVADLAAGSGIEFEARGEYELKGVPGRWRLYAVMKPSSRVSPAIA
jgi:class 3 adenylate cyclase